jgi:hypothetical protein
MAVVVQRAADAAVPAAAEAGHRAARSRRDIRPRPGPPPPPAAAVQQALHLGGQLLGRDTVAGGLQGQDVAFQLGDLGAGRGVLGWERRQPTPPAGLRAAAGQDHHRAAVDAGHQRRDRLACRAVLLGADLQRRPVAGPDDARAAALQLAGDAAGGQLLRGAEDPRGRRAAAEQQRGDRQQAEPATWTEAVTGGDPRVGDRRLDGVAEPVDERDLAHGVASSRRARRARPRWTRVRAAPSLQPSLAAISG